MRIGYWGSSPKPAMAKAKPSGRAGSCDITKARLIAESAEEVSQPDTLDGDGTLLETFCAPGAGAGATHEIAAEA